VNDEAGRIAVTRAAPVIRIPRRVDVHRRRGERRAKPEDKDFRASIRVTAGVALVTLVGRLEPSAMSTCRGTLDAVLRIRTPQIVLDLSQAQLDPGSIDLLKWMHAYVAHFGVQLSLTGVHHLQLEILRLDHLGGVLPVLPTDPDQRRAAARAERRDRSPGLEARRYDSPAVDDTQKRIMFLTG
jgi:hypothetical protein